MAVRSLLVEWSSEAALMTSPKNSGPATNDTLDTSSATTPAARMPVSGFDMCSSRVSDARPRPRASVPATGASASLMCWASVARRRACRRAGAQPSTATSSSAFTASDTAAKAASAARGAGPSRKNVVLLATRASFTAS